MLAITTSTAFFFILCAFKTMFLNIFLTSYRVEHNPSVLVTNINSMSYSGASLVAHIVQNLPAMQKTWVCSLGQEDPLEKRMVTHSSILAWRIPQTEEPGRLQVIGSQVQDTTEQLSFFINYSRINLGHDVLFLGSQYWVGQKVHLGFSATCYGKNE